jgi:indolepyruvate ferredoxin oxidoreductase, beta subunit
MPEVIEGRANVLFCGIGGQGVLKASEVCGVAAVLAGYHVKKSEVHGMAQRGGSVESHLRFAERVYSPLIPRGAADLLVCFDRTEGERLAPWLRPGGVTFVPYLASAAPADRRFLNTYLLGILSAHLPIPRDLWFEALRTVFERARDENRAAFLEGAAAAGPVHAA